MMFNFMSICGVDKATGEFVSLQPIWDIVGTIINIIMIGVPIALIIFGMVDLGKAVIASKEDEVKKATKLLGKRFLYAIGVFAVVWFVTFVFDTLSASTSGAIDYKKDSKNSWQQCWKCNIRKTLTKDGSDPSDPDDPYVNLCLNN